MTLDEMKTRLGEIAGQMTDLEQTEYEAYAELGRVVLPELEGRGTHAEIVSRIRETSEKLSALKVETASLEAEQKHRIAAITCYKCNTVSSEGAAFCEECGAKLGEKPKEYCEACGTMNHPGQKFCGECGARLKTE